MFRSDVVALEQLCENDINSYILFFFKYCFSSLSGKKLQSAAVCFWENMFRFTTTQSTLGFIETRRAVKANPLLLCWACLYW
jgi:hypothetical protein